MSVSGYILADPGLGLIKFVIPSSVGILVSAGMPIMHCNNLFSILFTATSIFSASPVKIMNPSSFSFSNLSVTLLHSSSVIP